MTSPTASQADLPTGRPAYTALIRTFNSEATLPDTLRSLERQSLPPHRYVFVDSGSTDGTLLLLPAGSTIHEYKTNQFNYSISLNLGIEYVVDEFTLILSSHTTLRGREAVEYAIDLLRSRDDIGAAYFLPEFSEDIRYSLINKHNFSGFNGVWNTCAIYKTELLKKRHFRPEVFSAEDQDWSWWLLQEEGLYIARIHGHGMSYNNPAKYPIRKRLNEELAVAIFVKPEMMKLPYVIKLILRVVRPISSIKDRVCNLLLAYRIVHRNLFRE